MTDPRITITALCAVGVLIAVTPPYAAAQERETRWGVSASFTPTWNEHKEMKSRLFWSDEDLPFEGSELTVGFVKGSVRGGDWGLSFVRKRIKDLSVTEVQSDGFCSGPNNAFCQTFMSTETTETRNLRVDGVEVHFFIPFVRLAERIQVGVNAGGGAAFPTGTSTHDSLTTSTITQPGQPPQTITETRFDERPVTDDVISKAVILMKVEAQAALLLAPGLKVRISGGLNVPSASALRIGVVYLFGAR